MSSFVTNNHLRGGDGSRGLYWGLINNSERGCGLNCFVGLDDSSFFCLSRLRSATNSSYSWRKLRTHALPRLTQAVFQARVH